MLPSGHEQRPRGHCFDSARFQMLNRKLGGQALGEIADFVYGALAHTTFSKTQEAEADEHGFGLVTAHGYDPMGVADAFGRLKKELGTRDERALNPFRDYFSSNPPLTLRIENFTEKAKRYLAGHADEKFYVGRNNVTNLLTWKQSEEAGEFRN